MAKAMNADNTDPNKTVELLAELRELGFGNKEFRVVHHFSNDTISKHLSYCRKLSNGFEAGGTNAKVQARLALVLNAYQKGGFSSKSNRSAVLMALTKAAVAEVPK